MICSPTEPAQLRDAADAVSMFPESFGADLVVPIHGGGWAGIQRKEIADLCASIEDNRLAEQLVKLRQLTMSMLIVEGELEWTNDGEMLSRRRWKSITRDRFDGVMWHVQADGTWVCFTRDLAETIRVAKHFEKWTAKPRKAMATRPPVTAAWGTPDNQTLDQASVLYRFWTAIGAGFANAYRALFQVSMESTSVTLDQSLEDWEHELGLPDPCMAETDSRAARIAAVRTRVLASAIVTPQDFIRLAASMGYEVFIEEPRPFECGISECGWTDEIAGSMDGQIEWDWIVSIAGQPARYFEMGESECGIDALTDWEPIQDIECMFRRIAPAWSRPLFVYP